MAKIVAKIFPIFLDGAAGAHLYYEVLDDNDLRIAQLNGLSMNRNTGIFIPAGSLTDVNDTIQIKITPGSYLNGTNDPLSGSSYTVYSGSLSDVQKTLSYLQEYKNYINAQSLDYTPVPSLPTTYNSTSDFIGITSTIEAATGQTYYSSQTFKNFIGPTPGVEPCILGTEPALLPRKDNSCVDN